MAEPKEIEKKGMGKDKGSRKYERASAADRQKANTDGKFGYFDEANKRFVPAFIDMIDGGNRDNRGDDFAGGPLSGILNALGVPPYGSLRDRPFGGPSGSPIQQAVAGSGADMDSSIRPRARPNQVTPYQQLSYGMGAGEAGRGFMPPDTPLPYATMNMGEAGRGSMPADTPLPYATMNMGEAGRGSMPPNMPPPVSTYGGDIDPTQDGRIQAQRNIDNRERMRQVMSQITKAEYDAMSRGEKANMGLPVRGIDLLFAGSDAFKQPMVGSGRGRASGDYGFDQFMNMVRNDANYSYLMNDPEMAYSVYNRMQQSGTQF
jgi:hypothetical protein